MSKSKPSEAFPGLPPRVIADQLCSEVSALVEHVKAMSPSECGRFFAMFAGMTQVDAMTYKADTRVLDIEAVNAAEKLGGLMRLHEHPAANCALVFRLPPPSAFPGIKPR